MEKLKMMLPILVAVAVLVWVLWSQSHSYYKNYAELTGRKAVSVSVQAGDGVDKIMSRALGAEANEYSLDLKRDVFIAFNSEAISRNLRPGDKVLVPQAKERVVTR